jgi:8-oxo-dGTP diphosphatase
VKNNSELNAKGHPNPVIRLEVVVLSVANGSLQVLLAKRGEAPFAGKWALPGGALRVDLDQTLDAGAKRVMKEQLGMTRPEIKQLCAVGGAKRDLGASWGLSVIYWVFVSNEAVQAIAVKRNDALEWRDVSQAMSDPLAFDHAQLVRRAVGIAREEAEGMIMPRGLLAEEFTLTELQMTCEQVLGHPIDKSSFRRKLADRSLVEPVDGAMRAGAFRPAQLYRLRNPRD